MAFERKRASSNQEIDCEAETTNKIRRKSLSMEENGENVDGNSILSSESVEVATNGNSYEDSPSTSSGSKVRINRNAILSRLDGLRSIYLFFFRIIR